MRLLIVGLVLLLATSLPAHSANPFFYLGASAQEQSVRLPDFTTDIALTGYRDVEFESDSEGSPFRVFVGYQFNNFFAVETSYTEYLTRTYTMKSTDTAGRVDLNGKSESISVDVTSVLNVPLSDDFAFRVKLGVAFWQNEADLLAGTNNTPLIDPDTDWGTSLLTGLGASYAINNRIAVMLDWDNRSVFGRNVESTGLSLAYSF